MLMTLTNLTKVGEFLKIKISLYRLTCIIADMYRHLQILRANSSFKY